MSNVFSLFVKQEQILINEHTQKKARRGRETKIFSTQMKQQVFFMNFHSAGLLNRISGDEIMLILNYLSPGYFSRGFKHFIKGFIGVKCC